MEPAHYILRALASSDFANESARERLMSIQLDGNQHVQAMVSSVDEAALDADNIDGFTSSREAAHIKFLRCGTLINLDSHVSVRDPKYGLFRGKLTVFRSTPLALCLRISIAAVLLVSCPTGKQQKWFFMSERLRCSLWQSSCV